PDLQQEVIRLLIDHVVVGKNEIVIKHIVPTDDDCRLKPQRLGVKSLPIRKLCSIADSVVTPEA
ncbi:MAG: hypothetical protein WBV59_17105, partial [Anaerolineae bacterium]